MHGYWIPFGKSKMKAKKKRVGGGGGGKGREERGRVEKLLIRATIIFP
jgi:hypothetical protein